MKKKLFLIFFLGSLTFNALAKSSTFEDECKAIDKASNIAKGVRIGEFSFYSKRLSVYKNARAITIHTVQTGSDSRLVLRYVFFDPSPTDNSFIDYLMSARHDNTLLDICYDVNNNIMAISDHES